MQKGSNQVKKILSFFIVYLLVFWAQSVFAFDLWKGEVTTNVNLRKSPGLDGGIITRLDKGDRVIVKDKYGEWYQVVLEKEIFGYKGWMNGQYLKRVQSKEEIEAVPSEEVTEEAPLEEKVSKTLLEEKEGEKEEEVKQEEKDKKGEKQQNLLKPPQEKISPQKSLPAAMGVEKNEPPTINSTENYFGYQGIRSFLRLLLRLASAILSCIALLFAYRAYKLAKACYEMTTQLQSNMRDVKKDETGAKD